MEFQSRSNLYPSRGSFSFLCRVSSSLSNTFREDLIPKDAFLEPPCELISVLFDMEIYAPPAHPKQSYPISTLDLRPGRAGDPRKDHHLYPNHACMLREGSSVWPCHGVGDGGLVQMRCSAADPPQKTRSMAPARGP